MQNNLIVSITMKGDSAYFNTPLLINPGTAIIFVNSISNAAGTTIPKSNNYLAIYEQDDSESILFQDS